MKIFIVGSGKLATAIISSDLSFPNCEMRKWESKDQHLNEEAVIVHAGSGRQLKECMEFCRKTDSVLIELSTGLETEKLNPDFTLILCSNTSILVLKIMSLLRQFGGLFSGSKVSVTESHQVTKTTEPGTAISIARSLNVPIAEIKSIRDPEIQRNEIGIPNEYLDKHAYHQIVIKEGNDEVKIETKVLGHDSYANGVKWIIDLVLRQSLGKKKYFIYDLIEKELL